MKTYPVSLADLALIADAASEFDGIKDKLNAADRARAEDFVTLLHELSERAAGSDAGIIYAEKDGA